jgi:hypothetical protein
MHGEQTLSVGRRSFQYATALIGFLLLLSGLLALSREAIRLWSTGLAVPRVLTAMVSGSSGWIGVGLVGLVLWAISWFPANHAARPLTLAGASERASAQRKAYLYTGQFLTLALGLIEAGLMVAAVLRHTLDLPTAALASWPSSALAGAAGALVAFLWWGYLRWVTVRDGDFGHELGRAASWRRAYLYLGALVGFALVIGGGISYLRAMLGLAANLLWNAVGAGPAPIPGAAAWHEPIVWSVTALIVGIPTAMLIWSTVSRLAADAPDREYGALSRVTLLHAGLLFGACASLVSIAYLLWQGLLLITAGIANTHLSWSNLILALVTLPVGIVSWLAFASAARRTVELSRGGRAGRAGAVAVRRLTLYLLAAAGLAAFWIGLTQLLGVILAGAGSPLAQPPAVSLSLQERFSLGAALVLVGAPAWWGYWWPRQTGARRRDAQGAGERSSLARKIYLYGVVAAGAVVLVLSLLTFAVPSTRSSFSDAVAALVARGGVAVFWLIAHLLVLRGDRRLQVVASTEPLTPAEAVAAAAADETAPAGEARSYRRDELPALAASAALAASGSAPKPVIVIDGGDGGLGASLLAALRTALPETLLWPLGLNPNAQAAMIAALGDAAPPALPPDALAQAVAIVGPSDLLLQGGLDGEVSAELTADLSGTTGRLILLPPRDPRLRWVAAPDWPDERWIDNAVIDVSNVLQ